MNPISVPGARRPPFGRPYGSAFQKTLPSIIPRGLRPAVRSAVDDTTKYPPEFPNAIFPPTPGRGFQKPPPKQSLIDVGTDHTAKAWVLNSIEFVHWLSFVPGFFVAWVMFSHSTAIAAATVLGREIGSVGAFLIQLGILTQVFGAGLSGNMVHDYEGWQLAPFRSPLDIPNQDNPLHAVGSFNNSWLRAVGYWYLIGTNTVGLLMFSVAVLGFKPWVIGWVAATLAAVFLGPWQPHSTLLFGPKGRKVPIFPIPLVLVLAFVANALLNVVALSLLFSPRLLPMIEAHVENGLLAKALSVGAAVVPTAFLGAAGVLEGAKAESTFNQYWHLLAFISVNVGLSLMAGMYLLVFAA